MLIYPGFFFVIVLSFVLEWIDRKFYADIQKRVGPNSAGPIGILQPFADFVKLMSKEDLTPKLADRLFFDVVPLALPALMLTALLLIPFNALSGLISFSGDVVFAIVTLTFFCIMVFLAGFSSRNSFSLMGAERAMLQLLGFEIPLMISIVGVCVFTSSVRIADIVNWQSMHSWVILGPQILGFIIFLVAAQAELERVPFDIPEAEQEIVAGWMTEYSGRKLALLRLAKDLELVFIAALAAVLYLGGPLGPVVPGLAYLLYPVYLVAKILVVLLILVTIRGAFARIRIDQMLTFAWSYLIPLSMVQIFITLLWRLL
jgi:NADH-quinone oxidoreductase subunit H